MGSRAGTKLTDQMRLTETASNGSSDASPARVLSPAWSVTMLIAGLLLVFELDRTTGSAPVQHLYYLPIIFAAVRFGSRGGLAASLMAILSYHQANPHLSGFRYEESDLVQVVLFVAIGVITAVTQASASRGFLQRMIAFPGASVAWRATYSCALSSLGCVTHLTGES